MCVAVWNPTQFLGRYPEFTAAYNANPTLFASLFAEAGLYLNNTDCSIVQDVNLRTVLLNQVTAHIAFIGGILTADGQPKPVGILQSASQGSVSATFQNVTPTPGTGAWFQMSQYGAAFWQATTCYRGMQYMPQPTVVEGFTGSREILGTNFLPRPIP